MVNLQVMLKQKAMIRLFRNLAEAIVLCFLLGGFSGNGTVAANNIEGVYATKYEGEYSKGDDSLVVQSINDKAYGIERRSSFQKHTDGIWQDAQHKITHWTAVYDESDHALHEQKQGILLYLNDSSIVWGNQHYIKCK
jgi:hypothetical protein